MRRMRALVAAVLLAVAPAFFGCGGVEDDAACRRMAVDVCTHRFGCFEVPDGAQACVDGELKACRDAPAPKSDACAAAVANQDCAQLHAHVVPDACVF
jgi:hypothetical protein